MNILGLDIVKASGMPAIYHRVDQILEKSIEGGVLSMNTRAAGVKEALKDMLRPDGRMSICTIRDMEELTGVVVSSDRMALYSTIHCVKWRDMEPDFREQVVAMIFDDFRTILNPADR